MVVEKTQLQKAIDYFDCAPDQNIYQNLNYMGVLLSNKASLSGGDIQEVSDAMRYFSCAPDQNIYANLFNIGKLIAFDLLNPSTSGDGLPSQTGNAGKILTTDGSSASWDDVATLFSGIPAGGDLSGTYLNPVFAIPRAILGSNTFTNTQIITQATVNSSILISTGYKLTGTDITPMIDLSGEWAGTGTASAFKLYINRTSTSSLASKLLDLGRADNSIGSVFSVTQDGRVIMGFSDGATLWTSDFLLTLKNNNYTSTISHSGGGALSFRTQYPTVGWAFIGAVNVINNSDESKYLYIYHNGTNATLSGTGGLEFSDGYNMVFNATNGTKIGTDPSQKLSLWGKTPITEPTTGVTAASFSPGTSNISDDSATFDGYTIGQVVAALRLLGAIA